jgi:hypothetical protein
MNASPESLQSAPVAARCLGGRPAYFIILLGGFCLGTLDLLFARIYWNAQGVTFVDVLHSIARGIYGNASRDGGAQTAIVGAVAHYFIATCMVLAYYLASRQAKVLLQRAIPLGLVYGVFLYFFMNLVVLPLSAAGMPKFTDRSWMYWSIAMHALFGVLCAFTARVASRAAHSSLHTSTT